MQFFLLASFKEFVCKLKANKYFLLLLISCLSMILAGFLLNLSALKTKQTFVSLAGSRFQDDLPLFVRDYGDLLKTNREQNQPILLRTIIQKNKYANIHTRLIINALVLELRLLDSRGHVLFENNAEEPNHFVKRNMIEGLALKLPKQLQKDDITLEATLSPNLVYWPNQLVFFISQDELQRRSGLNEDFYTTADNKKNSGKQKAFTWRKAALVYACLSLLAIFVFVMLALKLDYFAFAVSVLGLGLKLRYLFLTNFAEREHDHRAHLDYLQFVFNNAQLPQPFLNAASVHPPLYYVAAANFYKLANWLGIHEFVVFQFFTLLLSLGFVLFAIMVFKRLGWSKLQQNLATALVTLWPGLIINSCILNNDFFAAFFYVLTFYFFLKWLQDSQLKDFALACVFCTVTAFSKLLVVTLLLMLTLALLWELCKKTNTLKAKLWFVSCFSVPAVSSLYWLHYYNHNFSKYGFKAGFQQISGIVVQNKWQHFLGFDLVTFLQYPYVETSPVFEVRHNVWNFFWKTALFGEYEFWSGNQAWYAVIMSVCFCLLLLQITVAFVLSSFRVLGEVSSKKQSKLNGAQIKTEALFCSTYFLLLLSIAFGRLNHPVISMADFRYVIPLLIPLIYFGIKSFEYSLSKSRWIGYLIGINLLVFLVASCLFFL